MILRKIEKQKMWNELNESSLKFQQSLDMKYKKNNGIYYTGLELASKIIEDMFKNTSIKDPIWENTFFEPCGGVGNFIFAYLKYIYENFSLNKDQALKLIKNIYYCEMDREAQMIYIKNLIKFCRVYFEVNICREDLNIGNALIYNLNENNIDYIKVTKYFSKEKFDIIVTNPPYKSLRAEKRHYKTEEGYNRDKKKYEAIKKQAESIYKLSNRSSSNIFKYFVEDILMNYSHSSSIIAILIPSSILTDKSCKNLRKEILYNNSLKLLHSIPENNKYINAKQALTCLIIERKGKTDKVKISNTEDKDIIIDFNNFVSEEHGYAMMVLNEDEYLLLNKMIRFNKMKDFDFIINMRGELDLTLNKNYISSDETLYKLVKGRNINRYKLTECRNGFVSEEFVKLSPKSKYIHKNRIACQQIVNVSKDRRLMFTEVPKNYVLANSCNYIYIGKNNENIDLYYVLGLLNSKVMNWYFKLFSSNNHVNNYELDNLPIPTNNKNIIKKISDLSLKNSIEYSYLNDQKINDLVNELFNSDFYSNKSVTHDEINTPKSRLSVLEELHFKYDNCVNNVKQLSFLSEFKSELDQKVESVLKERKRYVKNNYIINNTSYKMSDLDMEIIKSVPEGGNWTYIPQETVNKSKRLLGIQKTGGRTTLYGRLRYNKPSYTITTYFNRPGNGCYIHPVNDRVLSTREAARLQCFPDNYYFYGNKKEILNQIGNAVPSVIGYQIGKKIIDKIGCNISLDLFSGAGGLLYGMKSAGIRHILANDIDKSACITLKANNPEIRVLNGDITNQSVKGEIIKKGIFYNADIICGGPPCQGFSLAGFRKSDDPRNKLFRDFYDVVKSVNPKVFVFENVIGLLSYNKGKTYEEIKLLFKKLGYKVEGKSLMFNEYGVPQKRKRVIVIGVRSDLKINPELLYPEKVTEKEDRQVTVKEAIGDLQNIKLDLNTVKEPESFSEFQHFVKGDIDFCKYIEILNKRNQI